MGKRELPEDLNTLKVPELKEELKERGLTITGLKADLVSRLQDFLKKQASEKDNVGKETKEEVNGKDHEKEEKEKLEKEHKEQKEKEEREKKETELREKEAKEKEVKEKEAKEKEAKEKEAKEKEAKEKEANEKAAKEKEAKEKEAKEKELKEKELKEKERKEKELREKEQKEKEQKEKEKQKEEKTTEKEETEDESKKRKTTDESETLNTSGRIIKPPTSSSTPSTKRQRTWTSQPEAITISTDILKDMLPSPSSSSLSSSQVDLEMEEATKNNNENNNSEETSARRASQQVYSTPAKRDKKQDPAVREVPAAKTPATSTLYIDRFVRPFTHSQVKQLLQQTGEIETFWMNQVKSHAYVTFKTEEQAKVTREAIYDLEWPQGNNSRLRAEFATADEAKKAAEHHDNARSTSAAAGSGAGAAGQTTRAENSARDSNNGGNLRDSRGAKREEPRGGKKSTKSLDEMFRKTETKPAVSF